MGQGAVRAEERPRGQACEQGGRRNRLLSGALRWRYFKLWGPLGPTSGGHLPPRPTPSAKQPAQFVAPGPPGLLRPRFAHSLLGGQNGETGPRSILNSALLLPRGRSASRFHSKQS